MTDRFRIVMPLIILGALFFSCNEKRTSIETFQTDSGWGYIIKHDNQVFIKQDHIPAIPGNYSFVREADAENTGKLVLQKLKNRKNPAILLHELDSLKVEHPPRVEIR